MIKYHAVFIDETGCGEFGATITAFNRAEAWEKAREDFPESRCISMESPQESREREIRTRKYAERRWEEGW